MKTLRKPRILLGLTLLSGVGVLYACQDKPTAPIPTADANATPHASVISAAPTLKPSLLQNSSNSIDPRVKKRIDEAMARTAWVGGLHHEAMTEWLATAKGWNRSQLHDAAVVCPALTNLGERYAAKAEARSGASWRGGRNAIVGAGANSTTTLCRNAQPMMIFRLPGERFLANARQSNDEITDEVVAYVNALMDALDNSDGSIAGAQAAVYNVLASATTLSPPNFDFLAGVGNVGSSSAVEWNNCPIDTCWVEGPGEEPMNIFQNTRRKLTGPEVKSILAMDAWACAAGVLQTMANNVLRSSFIAAGPVIGVSSALGICAVVGVIGSGGRYITIRSMQ